MKEEPKAKKAEKQRKLEEEAEVGPFNAYDLLHLSSHGSQRFPLAHEAKDIIAKIHSSV